MGLVKYAGHDPEDKLAETIRNACERLGYDIRIKAPGKRASLEQDNFERRSEELAAIIMAERA